MRAVVGVAVVEGDRVLAARRAGAGVWEFPGGKVEPGEDPAVTAVREIREELGCTIAVTGWLAGETTVDDFELRIATAELTDGDPVPTEHDAVRWLGAAQLDDVTWASADLPFLTPLRDLLDDSMDGS